MAPTELALFLRKFDVNSGIQPDDAAISAIPVLNDIMGTHITTTVREDLVWGAISKRQWAFKERIDGTKLHIELEYLKVKVRQRPYSPEGGGEAVDRCEQLVSISTVEDDWTAPLFKHMQRNFGCPQGKCEITQVYKHRIERVRSKKHKMVKWEPG